MINISDEHRKIIKGFARFDLDETTAGPAYGWGDKPSDKIVFLDIDDVLIGEQEWAAAKIHRKRLLRNNISIERLCKFNGEAIDNLNRVLHETQARIVVHSDWTLGYETTAILWDKLSRYFSVDQFHPDWCALHMVSRLNLQHQIYLDARVWGLWPGSDSRHQRIPGWLSWHNIESMVILDDKPIYRWARIEPQGGLLKHLNFSGFECECLWFRKSRGNPNWIKIGDKSISPPRDVLGKEEACRAIAKLAEKFIYPTFQCPNCGRDSRE